jgi:hypothetical protein
MQACWRAEWSMFSTASSAATWIARNFLSAAHRDQASSIPVQITHIEDSVASYASSSACGTVRKRYVGTPSYIVLLPPHA